MSREDSDIIEAVQAGRGEEYSHLVEKYQSLIVGIIYKQLGDYAISEDLSQEVFIKAYKGLKSFRGDASFKNWLVTIALNTTRNYFRSKAFKKRKLSESDINLERTITQTEEDVLERKDKLSALRGCFSKLKTPLQEVVTLCSFTGYSYEEAANVAAVPIGTVRSRLNTARLQLMQCMEKRGVL